MKLNLRLLRWSLGAVLALGMCGASAQEEGQAKEVTSEDMAKAKNVPAVLEDPAGNYQLVAVIEGAEPNRKLTQNLQVVGAQRQRLLALSQQYDRMPADAFAQRELTAGEILKLRKSLEQNLKFMASTYRYSLQNNYRLVPHAATLHLLTKDGEGKVNVELVHEFKDPESYQAFQKVREGYLLQTVEEMKKAAEAAGEAAEGEEAKEGEKVEFKPSADLKAKAGELIAKYNYDPEKNYQVNLEKTALYARPGR